MASFLQTPKLTWQYLFALGFTFLAHCRPGRFQVRKPDVPYLSHLLSVSARVMKYGGTQTEAIAALLHDTVEDVGVPLWLLRICFGADVAGIVETCSEPQALPKRDRKQQYVSQIKSGSLTAVLVSACDKLDNLEDYLVSGDLFNQGTRQDVLWFYDNLLPVYQLRLSVPTLLESLTLKLEVLKQLWQ